MARLASVSAYANWTVTNDWATATGFHFEDTTNLVTGEICVGTTNIAIQVSYGGFTSNEVITLTDIKRLEQILIEGTNSVTELSTNDYSCKAIYTNLITGQRTTNDVSLDLRTTWSVLPESSGQFYFEPLNQFVAKDTETDIIVTNRAVFTDGCARLTNDLPVSVIAPRQFFDDFEYADTLYFVTKDTNWLGHPGPYRGWRIQNAAAQQNVAASDGKLFTWCSRRA